MGGMAIGSLVAGRRFVAQCDPILVYALLEGWTGAYGLASPSLLRAVDLGSTRPAIWLRPARAAAGNRGDGGVVAGSLESAGARDLPPGG